jgi:type II secretory pathway pseudopilin PulG
MKSGPLHSSPVAHSHFVRGMTIVEIAIGLALLGLVAAGAFASLISLNKNAVRTRILTNAKEVVQRNIETAMALPFTSTNVPSILATTSASGSTWDDDGGGDNLVTIYSSRDGTQTVKGTLTRIVRTEANDANADIRRVTFRLDYSIFGKPSSYEITTLRSADK